MSWGRFHGELASASFERLGGPLGRQAGTRAGAGKVVQVWSSQSSSRQVPPLIESCSHFPTALV
jgi:hypothetical protein